MQDAISNKLVALMQAATDVDDNPLFGAVVDYDAGSEKFDTWPVCMVLPSDQPSDYGDNTVNDRREGFTVYVMLPLGDDEALRPQKYRNARIISDRVRNVIDKTIDLDALRANEGADRVMGVAPASAGWDIIESSAGVTLLLRISVSVRYSHRTQ